MNPLDPRLPHADDRDMTAPLPSTATGPTDEDLAAQCARGLDNAERDLLERYMQAIYWYPKQAFGADEGDLGDFLIFAVEKIRQRDILGKYDPDRGARFSTWFGVILRNLYLDYLRARPEEVPTVELNEATQAPAAPEQTEDEDRMLAAMHLRCRVLFKLLLCNSYLLTPDEVKWLSEKSGRGLLETARQVAELESRLAQKEGNLQERYDKLAAVCWWKNTYEKQLSRLEHQSDRPWTANAEELEKVQQRLEKRRREYHRIVHELTGTAGIATAPYRELAAVTNMPEGTVASLISRCRTAAAEFLRQERATQGTEAPS